jgi:ferritin-like metal-binding protein YciE
VTELEKSPALEATLIMLAQKMERYEIATYQMVLDHSCM